MKRPSPRKDGPPPIVARCLGCKSRFTSRYAAKTYGCADPRITLTVTPAKAGAQP